MKQDVEAHDAEENAGGESENEMQPGAELERKEPPGKGCAKSSKGEQESGHRGLYGGGRSLRRTRLR